jgi:hypothetical protein
MEKVRRRTATRRRIDDRHCEEPTGPALLGRPDDRLRDEAIQTKSATAVSGLLRFARNDEECGIILPRDDGTRQAVTFLT